MGHHGEHVPLIEHSAVERHASGHRQRDAPGRQDASPAAVWDFFVSYTRRDQAWAVWIAWELEAQGHRVLIEAWDFVPGSNWAIGMLNGMTRARRTIAVMSGAYLRSKYGRAEWMAAFQADPEGFTRSLIPVRIEDCDRPGPLGAVVSIDLFGLSAAAARTRLHEMVDQVVAGRGKPNKAPPFPAEYVPSPAATAGLPRPARGPKPLVPPGFPGLPGTGSAGRRHGLPRVLRWLGPALPPLTAFAVTMVTLLALQPSGSSGDLRSPPEITAPPSSVDTEPPDTADPLPGPTPGNEPVSGSEPIRIYDVDSDNQVPRRGSRAAYPSQPISREEYVEQVTMSSGSRISGCSFVAARASDEDYAGRVRVEVIQYGKALDRAEVNAVNNSRTIVALDAVVDPAAPWELRLTNIGDIDFGFYLKDGLDGVRISARAVRGSGVERFSDGLSGYVDVLP